MLGMSVEGKIFLSLFVAIIIAYVIALIIGERRKALWFKKRTKFSFFGKRGSLGDVLHFGYPCTLEGVGVTIGMIGLMAICTLIIFILL